MARLKAISRKVGRATLHRVCGGPYDGRNLLLRTGGTLPIRVGEWRGLYNKNGEWHDL